MRGRILEALDSLAHFLRLPNWLLRLVCDPYDRSVWAEFDTPEGEIDAMMADGEPVIPESPPICGWRCPHFTIMTSPGVLLGPPAKFWCDCEMQPVYATS